LINTTDQKHRCSNVACEAKKRICSLLKATPPPLIIAKKTAVSGNYGHMYNGG